MVKRNRLVGAAAGCRKRCSLRSASPVLVAVQCSCLLLFSLVTLVAEAAESRTATATETTKIIGGTAVTNPNKYPFFIEWRDAGCGASLIHDDIALSAAHCENPLYPLDSTVFMLGLETGTGISRTVTTRVAHPLYNGDLNDGQFNDYDFLILKLHTSALVDDDGNPTGASSIAINKDATLPAAEDTLAAMGFGKLNEDDEMASTTLQEVELECFSSEVCASQYSAAFLEEVMFCSGAPWGGKDTCQGDSGGPIVHVSTGLQVGVVSYGHGCGQADYAGINARVSGAWEWIEDQVCQLSANPPARCGSTSTNSGNNDLPEGTGEMSIGVTYDMYPHENAWSLTYLGPSPTSDGGPTNSNPLLESGGLDDGYTTQIQVFFSPLYQDLPAGDTIIQSFSNLPAGRYSAKFGDTAGDGMCCSYGDGKLEILDGSGYPVWENNGFFTFYIEVIFDLDASGGITIVEENLDYENSSESFTPFNHPPTFDPEWPGAVPVASRSCIAINLKFDSIPDETAWELYFDGGGSWELIEAFEGSTSVAPSDLVSFEVDNLNSGWHQFSITDNMGDGICCQYRRGWVSLTGPLITTQQHGLVWGNNGEFGSQIAVFFYIDNQGFVSQVSYEDPLTSSTTRAAARQQEKGDNGHQRHLTVSFTDLPKQHPPSQ